MDGWEGFGVREKQITRYLGVLGHHRMLACWCRCGDCSGGV